MPLDEYSAVSGGALRLKGAKVGKKSKKKKDKKLAKAVEAVASEDDGVKGKEKAKQEGNEDNDEPVGGHMTEAERRFQDVKRKKFLELQKNAMSNPELLKTHKERVEEMNVFLSKLSEHHDMPKIGPG